MYWRYVFARMFWGLRENATFWFCSVQLNEYVREATPFWYEAESRVIAEVF